ncbi:MAG: sensor histidine kinase [Gammaproteobacteria bacterium]
MRLRLGLRSRFLLASLGLGCVLIGGFSLAVLQFVEALEQGLSMPEFREEFVRQVRAWAAHPETLPAMPVGYRAYVAEPDTLRALPNALSALTPGIHEEVVVDGMAYAIGREDVLGRSFFLLRDARYDPVERMESVLDEIALFSLLAAMLLSVAVALWLANLVVRPVEALAQRVSAIVPGTTGTRFAEADDDPAIGVIARAFDAALDRYDELVARERAFARDASHELRTPLAVVLTGVELLAPALAREAALAARLDRIRAAAEQMSALTEGLLFLARPDAAPPALVADAREVVGDAVRIQSLATGKSFDCRVQLPAVPCPVPVPRGLLLCVINNLLRNAIEHGGAPIDLTLTADTLTIADRGPGVETDMRAAMFEAHARGSASSGHGLGLNIVDRICRRLGWGLTVDTAAGAGTRIVLHFSPAALPSPPR